MCSACELSMSGVDYVLSNDLVQDVVVKIFQVGCSAILFNPESCDEVLNTFIRVMGDQLA